MIVTSVVRLRDSPVPLAEGWDVGEALVAGGIVVSVRGPSVRHRRTLLVLVAFLSGFLLGRAQLQLPTVHQQRLVSERLLRDTTQDTVIRLSKN